MRFGGYKHPKVGGMGKTSGFRIRRAESGLGGPRVTSPYARASRMVSRATGMAKPAGSKLKGSY